jgi:hypothetical protein
LRNTITIMANHCNNWIHFMGSKESLEKLEKALGTYEGLSHFNEWVDSMIEFTPPKDDEREYYHYGTRWFEFQVSNDDDGSLFVDGYSAWSPPLEMTRSLCEHFGVEAKHEYEEMGNDFGGFIRIQNNGAIAEQQEYSYQEWRYREDADSFMFNLIDDLFNDLHCDFFSSLDDLLEEYNFLSQEHKKELENEWNKPEIQENLKRK